MSEDPFGNERSVRDPGMPDPSDDKSRSTRPFGRPLAGVAIAIVIAVLGWSVLRDRDAVRDPGSNSDMQALADRLDDVTAAQEKLAAGEPLPPGYSEAAPEAAPGSSDVAKLGVWVQRSAQRGHLTLASYQQEVAASKMDRILDPELLLSPTERSAMRSRLQSLQSAIDTYEREGDANLLAIEADLRALKLKPEMEREALRGFNHSVAENKLLIDRWVTIQRDVVAVAQGILTFFETRESAATAGEDGLVFRTQAEADQYNGFVARLQELATKENEITEKQLKALRKSRDDVRKRAD